MSSPSCSVDPGFDSCSKTGNTDWEATYCLVIGRTLTQHSSEARFGSGLKQITCDSFCELGWCRQYCDYATGSTVRNSNSGKGKTSFSSTSRQFLGLIQLFFNKYRGLSRGQEVEGWSYHSTISSADVKNERSYTSTSFHVFMAKTAATSLSISYCFLLRPF
jgi:hypothetical protein